MHGLCSQSSIGWLIKKILLVCLSLSPHYSRINHIHIILKEKKL